MFFWIEKLSVNFTLSHNGIVQQVFESLSVMRLLEG